MIGDNTRELRAMLGARGVGYDAHDYMDWHRETRWLGANGARWSYVENATKKGVRTYFEMLSDWENCTPAQAVGMSMGEDVGL